jgi:predicted PP-loop superfamily ATPase
MLYYPDGRKKLVDIDNGINEGKFLACCREHGVVAERVEKDKIEEEKKEE